MTRRRRRWVYRSALVLAVTGAAVGAALGPEVLRDADTFRVRQVEVLGARFIEPYDVVAAAGLDARSSVFDDADAWRAGILTLPLVDDVRIRRTLPSKLILDVREVAPVALVAAETLRPVDATGRLLALDPAGIVLDLPIVMGVAVRGDAVREGPSASAITTVATLLGTAPELAEEISQAELVGDELRLTFRGTRALAVIPVAATTVELTQLRVALADLRARGELDRVRTIDVRFRDQVVVSFLDTPVI